MNKKFLSAILFGALMVSSTGTFVSCKDYDDDKKKKKRKKKKATKGGRRSRSSFVLLFASLTTAAKVGGGLFKSTCRGNRCKTKRGIFHSFYLF